jgi:PPOX class probable F420-dependent enzyme
MAKARDIVRMSEAEISVFLDQSQSLQVATLGPDGAPHLTTVWFTVHEGNVLFETYGKSQKIVNLKRDSRIAVLAEDGKTYATLRGVSINGRAEVVEDFPERLDLMRVLVASMHPELSDEAIDDRAAKMATKRVVVKVHPEKVMSWDHHKLEAVGP